MALSRERFVLRERNTLTYESNLLSADRSNAHMATAFLEFGSQGTTRYERLAQLDKYAKNETPDNITLIANLQNQTFHDH
jgi:hypothetical protein